MSKRKFKEPIPPKALEVVMKVSEIYGISIDDILGKCRDGDIIIARHVAMHRLYTMEPKSDIKRGTLARIGRWFNRDHTTVLNALKKVKDYREIYEDFATTYDTLVRATIHIELFPPVPLTLEQRISRLPKDEYDAIVSFVENMEKKYGITHDAGKTGGDSQREVDSPSENNISSAVQHCEEEVRENTDVCVSGSNF